MAIIEINSQDHEREFDLTYSSDEPTMGGGGKGGSSGITEVHITLEDNAYVADKTISEIVSDPNFVIAKLPMSDGVAIFQISYVEESLVLFGCTVLVGDTTVDSYVLMGRIDGGDNDVWQLLPDPNA